MTHLTEPPSYLNALLKAERELGRLDEKMSNPVVRERYIPLALAREAVASAKLDGLATTLEALSCLILDPLGRDQTAALRLAYGLYRGQVSVARFKTDSNGIPSDDDFYELLQRLRRHAHLRDDEEAEEGGADSLDEIRRYADELAPLPRLIKAALLFRQMHLLGIGGEEGPCMARLLLPAMISPQGQGTEDKTPVGLGFSEQLTGYGPDLERSEAHWLERFLGAVTTAAKFARQVCDLQQQALDILTDKCPAPRSNSRIPDAIAWVIKNPVFERKGLMKALKCSQPGADQIISKLVASNEVGELTGRQKYRVYGVTRLVL